MNAHRFFRLVWRFNSVAIMVAALAVIAFLCIAGYMAYRDITRNRYVHNVVNVDDDKQSAGKWEFGRLSAISGASYVMLPLYFDQTYAQSYYGKSARSTRNLLFIDAETNDGRWLFDTNDYLIVGDDLIREGPADRADKPVRAVLYTVVKKDTDGDKRLTSKDKIDVALSLPNGRDYKEILNDIDHLIGHELINKDTMILVYEKQGIAYSANVRLSDFSVIRRSELPEIKKHP
jgi:hypothetical protein